MQQFRTLALALAVSHALVAPPQCARHSVTARSDYLDSMAPPAAAEEEAAPAVVEEVEEPAAPAPPAPMSLSESVLGEFSARSERNLEVARLQTQLERSQLRRKQVEEVIGEEVADFAERVGWEAEGLGAAHLPDERCGRVGRGRGALGHRRGRHSVRIRHERQRAGI